VLTDAFLYKYIEESTTSAYPTTSTVLFPTTTPITPPGLPDDEVKTPRQRSNFPETWLFSAAYSGFVFRV